MTTDEILKKYKKIAVVGYSDKPMRDSGRIAKYLSQNGYKVYGVNPRLEGECLDGIDCYKSLKDIPDEVEIVDVFRRSEVVEDLVKEILELDYKPKVIWTQLEIKSEEGKKLAEENGIEYIEDKCIYVQHKLMK